MRRFALALAAALAVAPALDVLAQQRPQPPRTRPQPAPPPPKEPEKPPEPPPAPYEKDLLRLSEIMGSLAFLRELCKAPDAGEWRTRMEALLDAEGVTPGRRERLAGAFNRGYKGFALTYRVCTPAAVEATARYLKEGEGLSRSIAGRFGG